jgi:hypothetical protein
MESGDRASKEGSKEVVDYLWLGWPELYIYTYIHCIHRKTLCVVVSLLKIMYVRFDV